MIAPFCVKRHSYIRIRSKPIQSTCGIYDVLGVQKNIMTFYNLGIYWDLYRQFNRHLVLEAILIKHSKCIAGNQSRRHDVYYMRERGIWESVDDGGAFTPTKKSQFIWTFNAKKSAIDELKTSAHAGRLYHSVSTYRSTL